MAHHFILLRLNPFGLRVDREGWCLSTLCHSCGFACQQRVIKTFPGPGCLHSEDGVVWLWHSLVNLYIYIYIYQIKSEDKNFNFQIIRASATYVASIYKQQNISRRLTFEEWFYWYQQARVPLVQPLIHKCLKNSLWLVIIVVICLPKFCTQYRQGVHYFLETKFNVFSRFFT